MPKVKPKRFHWKGVRVSEKIYNFRLKQQETGKNLRNVYGIRNVKANLKIEEKEYRNSKHVNLKDEGYKLVNMETIAKQLICKQCKNVLSLLDTACSIPSGLCTTYYVTCRQCNCCNDVLTDNQHPIQKSGKLTFNSNTTAVLGTVNGGGGITALNKLLTVLGVSPMNSVTYKIHEKEVADLVNTLVEESCTRAAQEERQLTIENAEELKKLLPEHLQKNYIFPGVSQHDEENKNISPNDIVRVAGSFDMGWPTKGSGRSYDSLSGTAGIIGRFGKKVISQVILNRKCRLCDLGHPKSDHDCKLNYYGTAKGMEPTAAALLVGESNKILSACSIQLGIFIGDCDSSAIQAARNAVDYEIVKHDDVNHTANTLTSKLFKSEKKFKELNSTTIKYLTKCFNYSVAQNKGNIVALANAIRNMPFHAFNLHANCGDWCQYSKSSDTYKHSVIGYGFEDPHLFDFLLEIFDEMAERSCSFAGGVSSNANESFYAMVASKSPKSRLHGTSFSYNLRVGLAVLKKNEGEQHIIELLLRCKITLTKKLIAYCLKIDKNSSIRYRKAITAEFKRQRILLKQKKAELKQKHEIREGPTYESKAFANDCIYNSIKVASVDNETKPIVVFFDLETGSLSRDCYILQIAAKFQNYEFNTYVKPNQTISEQSSQVHGLTFTNGRLLAHGKEVIAVNLQEALIGLYQFLYRFKRLCVLTAHNCSFDYIIQD